MSPKTCLAEPRRFVMRAVLALALVGLILAAVACGDSTPTTSSTPSTASMATAVEETTTSAEATPATSEQSTTSTATEVVTASEPPALLLNDADNGREVVLRVGERMRIDLKPGVNDRIKSVEWNYEPIVVKETDSGSDVVGDVVTGSWLELEGVVAGPVTVRAKYEYPYGTVNTVWVVYVEVVGTATTVGTGEPAALYVTDADNAGEVVLNVGERMRIDLAPKVSDRVASVEWSYDTLLVKEADSGANIINDVVVGSWLELEAVAAGHLTVRAQYEYPGGTTVTPWAVFVTVAE